MDKKILLNIGGKEPVEVRYTEKDLSFFKLDLTNPRLSHLGVKNQKEAEEKIWEEKNIVELYNAILESKGLSEPVFSKPDGTVIEGNRRIVCLKKIKEKYGNDENIFPKERFKRIQTYIIPEETPPIQIDVLLARFHVSGKKEWKSITQAEHVYNLKEKHGLSFEQIKNLIGMSKGSIHQKYWAYTETKKFLKKFPKESLNRYSFFEEAYKKKNIKEFLEKDDPKLFYSWIRKGKFDHTGAKDIRYLSLIFDKKELMKLFGLEGIKKAYHEYQKKYEISEDSFKLISDLLPLIDDFSEKEIYELKKDTSKIVRLKKLHKAIESLLKKLK